MTEPDPIALLEWALDRGDVGVYSAGSNLHGVEGHTWHCHGCDGFMATKGLHWDRKPHFKDFPHGPNCKVAMARRLIHQRKLGTLNQRD